MGDAERARPLTLTIAHVLSSFGMGGQERVALDLATGQRALGHEVLAVSLASGPDGPLAEDFRRVGAEVHAVPKGPGVDATLPVRLLTLFARARVDVVHTHNPQPLIYASAPARLLRARLVHTKHGANPGSRRRLLLRRTAARLCHAYVAVSETTAEIARALREVDPARLRTIPNGIDLSRFHPDPAARAEVRGALGLSQDVFLVGTVGRLAPEKDQALLVDALAGALSDRLGLVIVGDGPEADPLRARVAALGDRARHVQLVGARRDVPRWLAALDVFALSSRTEGLPLVIPEAMAVGLPVVSTAVGGIPTVVEEARTGHLVPPGDRAALAAPLLALAADPARARALGAAARDVALERYSAERMTRDYLAVYLGDGP